MSSINLDKEMQTVELKFMKNLTKGDEYLININFRGIINKGSNGFYRTKYIDQEKNEVK